MAYDPFVVPANETRAQRESRWYDQHKWEGPKVTIGPAEVESCSVCGADISEQRPCKDAE